MARAKRLGRFSFKEERQLLEFSLKGVSIEVAAARLKRPVASVEKKAERMGIILTNGTHPNKRSKTPKGRVN